jgi:serine/threonine-protein kinase
MPPSSVQALVTALQAAPLLEAAQRTELLESLQERFTDPRALADELRRRGWLSDFQADQLLQGKGSELVLGPYVLVEWLGAGGMGQVFKARHVLLKRTVAVKVIRRDRLADPQAVQRFLREMEAAGQVCHPNVVLTHDAAQVGDTFLLAMEFIDGQDLARRVRDDGPLPVARACDVIRQAALGLQHAHERGLVHRDVKPSNLLVTADGVVKIVDLGLARLCQAGEAALQESLTDPGAVMGTPHYLAPEQARDAHRADIRSDIYSLGCTFYYLLTGRPPFAGKTLAELVLRHADGAAEPVERVRPEVPAAVGAIVRRMMARRAADRYQVPAEVARALAQTLPAPPLGPAPDLTTTVDARPAQGRPGRNRGRLLGAAAGLLGLILLVLAWRFSGGRQDGPVLAGPGKGEPPAANPPVPAAAGTRMLRPTSSGALAPVTVVPYRFRPATRPGLPSRNVRIYQENEADDSVRTTVLGEGGVIGHVQEGPTFHLGALVVGSRGLRVVVNPRLGYTTALGLRFKDDATLAVLEEGVVATERTGVRALGPDGVVYVSRDTMVAGEDRTVMMFEVYHWLPPLKVSTASRNIQVVENGDATFTITGLGADSAVAAGEKPGGGQVALPDALGSKNVKVVVNRAPGYTTVAGLRFAEDVTMNITRDGFVEIDRPGVLALEPFNKEVYVSRAWEPRRGFVMVLAERAFPPGETNKK